MNLFTASSALVAIAVFPLLCQAQKFQEPTKEELQMASDPKAPDAPAVYLYLEEKMDNETHIVTEYGRIKIFTEKGKAYATIRVPYAGVFNGTPIIEGRTIHPDGAVIPIQGKAADLLVYKTTSQDVKEAVFNMPSVEVGSILEYRWTVPMTGARFTDGTVSSDFWGSYWAGEIPWWDVQKSIYVHEAHYYYNPARIVLYASRLPDGFHVVKSLTGDFTLDIHDVPAIPNEQDAPSAEAFRYSVRFYQPPELVSLTVPDRFWSEEGTRWSKELNSFAAPTETVKAAADQITAGAATPEAKARELYELVQALDNTEFSRQKTEAERRRLRLKKNLKKAQDVLAQRSGSGNELAALYLAMLRAAGLNADGLKIADRREGLFDRNYLSLDQLDTLLVVLHLNGKDVYVDPGEKLCPFGQLHWSHTMAGGLQENLPLPTYTPANLTKDAITAHAADLIVDSSGNVAGTVQLVMNGPAALHWRQLNLTADSDEVKRQLNESLHRLLPVGMNAEITGVKGLETAEGYLQVTAKASGTLGTVTGKRVLLPAFLFSGGAEQRTFVREDKREWPVDLHYAEQVIDDVVYHLPAGYQVESAPQAAQLPWPDHAALVVKVTADPAKNTVDVRHTFARAFALLDAKEYPALHDYYQKMATNDQQQVVLSQAGAVAGN